MHRFFACILLCVFLVSTFAQTPITPYIPKADQKTPIADTYRDAAGRIIGAALSDDTAYRRLAYLSDRIGNRLSGSAGLDAAIKWAVEEMKKDGLDNVRAEKVMVPHWVRGQESAELIEPIERRLTMLGLGNSIGTPAEGIVAEVVVVSNFDELEKLGENVRGKIVLFNVPFTSYGATVAYRGGGASRAVKYGAVAALVRSVGPVSLNTPHTGGLRYDDAQPKIPAAALTIEGAETLARMQGRGERILLRLKMEAKFLPDAESANVVAEIRGTERPEEVVVIGGHFDSWDVGTGSTDDGGGCLIAWETIRLLKKLNLRPKRTIRVVLWTNEENGGRGGAGYRDAHKDELANHLLAIESDGGVFKPLGFGLSKNSPALAREQIKDIATLLRGIGADRIGDDGGGADISPLIALGLPGMGLNVDGTHYFDIHHTWADTMDKIDPREMQLCVATMAVMSYVVADMPARLGK